LSSVFSLSPPFFYVLQHLNIWIHKFKSSATDVIKFLFEYNFVSSSRFIATATISTANIMERSFEILRYQIKAAKKQ